MDFKIFNRLKGARNYLNLTQEYVAKYVGIPRAVITEIESGQRDVLVDELLKFSEIYGLTFDQIVYGEDENQEVKILDPIYADLPEIDKMEIQNLLEFKNIIERNNS